MFSEQVISTVAVGVNQKRTRAHSLSQERREKVWAWLTLVALILCWDASLRLDERISPPRVRIAHIGESADVETASIKRR